MMEELSRQWLEWGMRGAVVAAGRAQELGAEIAGRRARGELDEAFASAWLGRMCYDPPAEIDARSLIVMALPRPRHQAVFTRDGRTRALVIPPTYVDYGKVRERVEAQLGQLLAAHGYHVATVRLPLKLLAVRSGLARYGRTNITYVPGMGTAFQLIAVYSDMPCDADNWGEAQMLDRCRDCDACRRACPTGAISSDRFLLHAERCITYHNEKPADVPFPDWIRPAWHNSLVGCEICQRACPECRAFEPAIGGREEFTAEETALLLAGAPVESLAPATVQKLERLDLVGDLSMLARNVGVFFRL